MRRAVFALLVGLLLAGCLEPRASEDAGGADPSPIVAFLDHEVERGANRTLLVLREDARADRLTYVPDGMWIPHLAPGLEYDLAELETLLTTRASEQKAGALVVRIERGSVDEDALRDLAPFLEGAWPEPFLPPMDPGPWYQPLTMARMDPLAVTETTPEGDEHLPPELARVGELRRAFVALAGTFEPETTQETSLMYDADWDGCLRAQAEASHFALMRGEPLEVRVIVKNCGETEARLDPRDCTKGAQVHVHLGGAGRLVAVLPATEAPSAAYAVDGSCRGDADLLAIPAGGGASFTRRWNGSLASCRADGACEYRPAESGPWSLFTFATGQRQTSHVEVTLLAPDTPKTRFLLVEETAWANTSSSDPVMVDFGPHCAPVDFTLGPASVTLRHYEERPDVPRGVIVRDWRDKDHQHVVPMNGGGIEVLLMGEGNVTLASPFEGAPVLAQVSLDGEDFLLDGTRLAPGETRTETLTSIVDRDGRTYEVTSRVEMRNIGEAGVLFERLGGCM